MEKCIKEFNSISQYNLDESLFEVMILKPLEIYVLHQAFGDRGYDPGDYSIFIHKCIQKSYENGHNKFSW